MSEDANEEQGTGPVNNHIGIDKERGSGNIDAIVASTRERAQGMRTTEPSQWSKRFFNNFVLAIPGKIGKEQRKLFEDVGILDEYESGDYNSAYMKSKTLREFHADIDAAIAQNGVDMKRVDELFYSTRNGFVYDESDPSGEYRSPRKEQAQELQELFTILEPAYLALRQMGYSHYDLAGIL